MSLFIQIQNTTSEICNLPTKEYPEARLYVFPPCECNYFFKVEWLWIDLIKERHTASSSLLNLSRNMSCLIRLHINSILIMLFLSVLVVNMQVKVWVCFRVCGSAVVKRKGRGLNSLLIIAVFNDCSCCKLKWWLLAGVVVPLKNVWKRKKTRNLKIALFHANVGTGNVNFL